MIKKNDKGVVVDEIPVDKEAELQKQQEVNSNLARARENVANLEAEADKINDRVQKIQQAESTEVIGK